MTSIFAPPPVPPPASRNAGPIRDRLADLLPAHVAPGGLVLEIASGSGHHAAVLAEAFPQYTWQPSDQDEAGCATVTARVRALAVPNLRMPMILDVTALPWPVTHADAVLCINMIHISPWAATEALFAGAASILPAHGVVVTYGPYRIDGDWGADSNRAFDESLSSRNPAWGVREVHDIAKVATAAGFGPHRLWPMPANNFMLAFGKTPSFSTRPEVA